MASGPSEPPHPERPRAAARGDATGDATSAVTPPPVAIGVDLIERARLRSTYARYGQRFLTRVFTPLELAQGEGRIERLAGRFAAKEACAKTLGTGIGAVSWHEIEVVRLPGGKPAILLHGRAAERAHALHLTAFDVSIADTRDHAMAVVVAVRG